MRLRDLAAPPGFDPAAEIRRVKGWLLTSCACFLLFFTFPFLGNLCVLMSEDLVRWSNNEYMPPFSELVALPGLSFLPMPCALVWLLARNIGYFRGSKSYYTMKRLPNRWEYPLRCALLPVGGALALFVSVNLLLLLMGGLYLWATPPELQPLGAKRDILELILGGAFA